MHDIFRRIVCLAAVLLLAGCGAPKQQSPGYRQVSTEEAVTIMSEESDYLILDVRTQQEYAQGHIPCALCIPNETISTRPIPELPDKGQLILIYCRSGNRSRQAAQKLADQGYTNIVEFGGINTWTGETVSDSEG